MSTLELSGKMENRAKKLIYILVVGSQQIISKILKHEIVMLAI